MQELLFAEVLNQLVERTGYTSGQLSRLSGISKSTINNWLQGRVSKPRVRNDLLKLAVVLHLNPVETNRLLQAAGHPSLPESLVSPEKQRDEDFSSPWFEILQREPFPVIIDPPGKTPEEQKSYALQKLLRGNHRQAIHSVQLFHLLSLAALLIVTQPQAARAEWIVYLLESIEAEARKTSPIEMRQLLDDVVRALSDRIKRSDW